VKALPVKATSIRKRSKSNTDTDKEQNPALPPPPCSFVIYVFPMLTVVVPLCVPLGRSKRQYLLVPIGRETKLHIVPTCREPSRHPAACTKNRE